MKGGFSVDLFKRRVGDVAGQVDTTLASPDREPHAVLQPARPEAWLRSSPVEKNPCSTVLDFVGLQPFGNVASFPLTKS